MAAGGLAGVRALALCRIAAARAELDAVDFREVETLAMTVLEDDHDGSRSVLLPRGRSSDGHGKCGAKQDCEDCVANKRAHGAPPLHKYASRDATVPQIGRDERAGTGSRENLGKLARRNSGP